MILTMAAVAITTRKRLERTCPKCGKKQTFPPNRINEVVLCPMLRDTDSAEKEELKLVGSQQFRNQSIDFQYRERAGRASPKAFWLRERIGCDAANRHSEPVSIPRGRVSSAACSVIAVTRSRIFRAYSATVCTPAA